VGLLAKRHTGGLADLATSGLGLARSLRLSGNWFLVDSEPGPRNVSGEGRKHEPTTHVVSWLVTFFGHGFRLPSPPPISRLLSIVYRHILISYHRILILNHECWSVLAKFAPQVAESAVKTKNITWIGRLWVTSAQCLLLTESWIARRNNTQWIPISRS